MTGNTELSTKKAQVFNAEPTAHFQATMGLFTRRPAPPILFRHSRYTITIWMTAKAVVAYVSPPLKPTFHSQPMTYHYSEEMRTDAQNKRVLIPGCWCFLTRGVTPRVHWKNWQRAALPSLPQERVVRRESNASCTRGPTRCTCVDAADGRSRPPS